jgi:hypothetical protein
MTSVSNSDSSSKGNFAGTPIGERFNPYRIFNGIFIPEAICKYRGVSPGSKLVYVWNP